MQMESGEKHSDYNVIVYSIIKRQTLTPELDVLEVIAF